MKSSEGQQTGAADPGAALRPSAWQCRSAKRRAAHPAPASCCVPLSARSAGIEVHTQGVMWQGWQLGMRGYTHVKACDVLACSAMQALVWGSLLRAGTGGGSLHVILPLSFSFRAARVFAAWWMRMRMCAMHGKCQHADGKRARAICVYANARCTFGGVCCELRMEAVCL